MRRLPGLAQEVADVIGRPATMRLIGASQMNTIRPWRRCCVYVPVTLPVDHELVRLLGFATAERLVSAFRGCILELPNCADMVREHRDRVLCERFRAGATPHRLALEFELTYQAVRNILRQAGLWDAWCARRAEIPPEDVAAANDNAPRRRRTTD